MTPRQQEIVEQAANRYGLSPLQLTAKKRAIGGVLKARVEVAIGLDACGYSTGQIGLVLNRDHTTVLYYLGRLKKAQPTTAKLRWRAPCIKHLHCHEGVGCFICRIGPKPPHVRRSRAKRTDLSPQPQSQQSQPIRYLVPYAGADFGGKYVWKRRENSSENNGV